MSASPQYKVRPYAIENHEVGTICGGSTRAEFYSIADSSTTVGSLPIRFPGGYWA